MKPQTLQDCFRTLNTVIPKPGRHPLAEQAEKYADTNLKLSTGKDADQLLVQVLDKETPAQFKFRRATFHPITVSAWSKVSNTFMKVHRSNLMRYVASYRNDTGVVDHTQELKVLSDGFHYDEGVQAWLCNEFRPLGLWDPNAYISLEYGDFDRTKARPISHATVFTSKDVLWWKKTASAVEWVLVQLPGEGGKKSTVRRFLSTFTIDVEDVSDPGKYGTPPTLLQLLLPGQGIEKAFREKVAVRINNRTYLIRIWDVFGTSFNDDTRYTPVLQPGYLKDPNTRGELLLSPMDPALPRMMSSLKSTSELGITSSNLSHPTKLSYVPDCEECSGTGKAKNGEPCEACDGKGRRSKNSAAAGLELPMPADGDLVDENLVTLSKLVHFAHPDPAILRLQMDRERELEEAVPIDVFSSTQHVRNTVATTATETNVDQDAQGNCLSLYAVHIANSWTFITRTAAVFAEVHKGLHLQVYMPDQFVMKGLSERMAELKLAKDAGATPATLDVFEGALMEAALNDDPVALKQWKVQRHFRPFRGISPDVLRVLLVTPSMSTTEDRTLYTQEAPIYRNLETKNPGFYELKPEQQWPLIQKEVAAIIVQLEASVTAPVLPGAEGGAGAVQDTALNGAQMSSLIDIIVQVAEGTLTVETALPLITAGFPAIDEKEVKAMLAGIKRIPKPTPVPPGGQGGGVPPAPAPKPAPIPPAPPKPRK